MESMVALDLGKRFFEVRCAVTHPYVLDPRKFPPSGPPARDMSASRARLFPRRTSGPYCRRKLPLACVTLRGKPNQTSICDRSRSRPISDARP